MKSKRQLLKERREHHGWVIGNLNLVDMMALPHGFLCMWVRKKKGRTDGGHELGMYRSMALANAHSEGNFQYVMHEFDDWVLRKMVPVAGPRPAQS